MGVSSHSHCMPAGGNVSVQHLNWRKYTIRFINALKKVLNSVYTHWWIQWLSTKLSWNLGVWDNQCTPCRLNGDFVFMQTPIGCWHMIISQMLIQYWFGNYVFDQTSFYDIIYLHPILVFFLGILLMLLFCFAAECFKDRTDVQCLHRWQKVLNPELVKGPWSKEVSI